jgi:hypothetical protein
VTYLGPSGYLARQLSPKLAVVQPEYSGAYARPNPLNSRSAIGQCFFVDIGLAQGQI